MIIANNINRSSDVSGGTVEVGRRDFTLRFEGRYQADQLKETIIIWRDGAPVTLGDIATVYVGPDKARGITYQNGKPALGMRVLRQPGSNTLTAIDSVLERMDELNETLPELYGLTIEKSFDPSVFIRRAVCSAHREYGYRYSACGGLIVVVCAPFESHFTHCSDYSAQFCSPHLLY